MALVPGNASIMTQFNLYPYFANRQYDELIYGDHFFKPEYILADANVSAPLAGVDESAALENYLASSSYSISARNGSAILWKAVR
jgi:hypothetical protein